MVNMTAVEENPLERAKEETIKLDKNKTELEKELRILLSQLTEVEIIIIYVSVTWMLIDFYIYCLIYHDEVARWNGWIADRWGRLPAIRYWCLQSTACKTSHHMLVYLFQHLFTVLVSQYWIEWIEFLHFAGIRNDLKNIMKKIEENLHVIHSLSKDSPSVDSISEERSYGRPIARVANVKENSPAEEAVSIRKLEKCVWYFSSYLTNDIFLSTNRVYKLATIFWLLDQYMLITSNV